MSADNFCNSAKTLGKFGKGVNFQAPAAIFVAFCKEE